MARQYFNWDNLVLTLTVGEDTFQYPFLGRWSIYENLSTVVGVAQHDLATDGPFVPYELEQLTGAAGVAQKYRISGGGKSTVILVAVDKISDSLAASGVVGKQVQIGNSTVTIDSIAQIQKDSYR